MNQESNTSTKQHVFTALRRAGRGLTAASGWLGDRIDDFAHWLANLIRYLPVRVGRLGLTLGFALIGVITFLPVGLRVWRRGGRAHFSAWLRSRVRMGRSARFSLRCRCSTCSARPSFLRFSGGR